VNYEVALSPVVCAATWLMTVNPVIDSAAPARMANIANIVIVLIGRYESSLIYKITIHWWLIDKYPKWETINRITLENGELKKQS
jgi:hypothetical protein